jgi:shikimate kinase
MIRVEVTTAHKTFVFYEGTIEEARAYTKAMVANGVTVLKALYFDKEEREAAIRSGKVTGRRNGLDRALAIEDWESS